MVILLYHHFFITQLSIKRRIPSYRNRRQGPSAETKRLALNTTHTYWHSQHWGKHFLILIFLWITTVVVMLSCHDIFAQNLKVEQATILTPLRSWWYFTLCFSWYPTEGQGGVRAASGAGHPVLWLGGGHGRLRGHAAVLFQKPV